MINYHSYCGLWFTTRHFSQPGILLQIDQFPTSAAPHSLKAAAAATPYGNQKMVPFFPETPHLSQSEGLCSLGSIDTCKQPWPCVMSPTP